MQQRPIQIAVIGGGISGLSAAHRLQELDSYCRVTLFEASERIGGVIRSEQQGDCLVDRGADMFTTRDPWALDLCQRINFDNQLISTNGKQRRAFVVHRGQLCEVPPGFTLMSPSRIYPVLRTPLLSWKGKLRLAAEILVPRKKDQADESLTAMATRRFGQEAYERLIQPLIGGIYTADPEKLSMAATMPQFAEMEREFGSLIRGVRKAAQNKPPASGARYGMFVAPQGGMTDLVDAIAARLPTNTIQRQRTVSQVQRTATGWEVHTEQPQQPQVFDGVLVAIPAFRAADILACNHEDLATQLRSIPYASAAVTALVYRREQIKHALNGFGFVVPQCAGRRILAASFSHVKFAGRAPQDLALIRVFLGGALQPQMLDLADHELEEVARRELNELIGAQGPPINCQTVRWKHAMPQYHVGHLTLVSTIEQAVATLPGLEVAGNAYRGVGIPFCIRSGEQAAQRLLTHCKQASRHRRRTP